MSSRLGLDTKITFTEEMKAISVYCVLTGHNIVIPVPSDPTLAKIIFDAYEQSDEYECLDAEDKSIL